MYMYRGANSLLFTLIEFELAVGGACVDTGGRCIMFGGIWAKFGGGPENCGGR